MSEITPYIGFPTTAVLKSKLNSFLEAAEASDKMAGPIYVEVIAELTHLVVDTLLLQTVEIAKINPTGQKVMQFCASTSAKVSNMLTSKIYKKADPKEMKRVAEIWQAFLKNIEKEGSNEWYILTPIDQTFSAQLDAILAERAATPEGYTPADLEDLIAKLDTLMDTIIETFFMKATHVVTIGGVTRKMLSMGVDSVKAAIHAVLHKVVKHLGPEQMGAYMDHVSQFYKKI